MAASSSSSSSSSLSSSNLPKSGQFEQVEASKIRVELELNIQKEDDFAKIDEALKSKGVKLISANAKAKTIQLELGGEDETTNRNDLVNVQTLQKFIEKQTGILTVVKGLGELSSAVAELRSPSNDILIASQQQEQVIGVIRLSQLVHGRCFFDGVVEGFRKPDEEERNQRRNDHFYSLAIHEFGDLSGHSYEFIGEPIVDIDKFEYNEKTPDSVSIRKIVANCDVSNMIGRSVAVTRHFGEESAPGRRVLSAGVVARASTIEGNKKQICSCSGKTIWEERLAAKQQSDL